MQKLPQMYRQPRRKTGRKTIPNPHFQSLFATSILRCKSHPNHVRLDLDANTLDPARRYFDRNHFDQNHKERDRASDDARDRDEHEGLRRGHPVQ